MREKEIGSPFDPGNMPFVVDKKGDRLLFGRMCFTHWMWNPMETLDVEDGHGRTLWFKPLRKTPQFLPLRKWKFRIPGGRQPRKRGGPNKIID